VIVAALVCLLVVMAILGTMLQSALRAHRQLRVERDRRQTEFLVEAGAERAASLLRAQPDFRGDTWRLPAAAILGSQSGQVTTEVSRPSSEPRWEIRVSAEYPLDSQFSIRRSRTFFVTNPMTQGQE
jgi:hypothetical protein